MLLDVQHLTTRFYTHDGEVCAVSDVSFSLQAGECLGIVGESGSGKTQVFLSLMGLLAKNGTSEGNAFFADSQILNVDVRELNKLRGVDFSMIFQDPMTSLNPYLRISKQMNEVLIEHRGISEQEASKKSIELLELVGIPEARKRFRMYPHEFSGGMRQRVMIAMALLCQPKLLIADEPTTALDVTVQAQILELIAGLGHESNMATILITHDLGVIAGLADRVIVMYGGRIVEEAPVIELYDSPQHPYTKALISAVPIPDPVKERNKQRVVLQGDLPSPLTPPSGCVFRTRCPVAQDICSKEKPKIVLAEKNHQVACHFWDRNS